MNLTNPFEITVNHAARVEIVETVGDTGYLTWGKHVFQGRYGRDSRD